MTQNNPQLVCWKCGEGVADGKTLTYDYSGGICCTDCVEQINQDGIVVQAEIILEMETYKAMKARGGK